MSIASVIAKVGHLITGSTAVTWAKGELYKGLVRSADIVAAKYGDVAKALVVDAESAVNPDGSVLTSAEKLFKVAGDLAVLVAKDGPVAPFGTLLIVAQQAYEQTQADALAAVNAFLAVAK